MNTLKNVIPPALLAVVVVSVFGSSLGCFFAQDDFIWLRVASSVHTIRDFLSFFTKYNGAGNYRPLSQEGYFLLNYHLFGLNAFAFHLMNLLVHTTNAVLVFCLLRRLDYDRMASFSGALFYGLNTALYLSVFWISAISESCMAMFYLLSVVCFLAYLKDSRRLSYGLSVIFFLAALMSKEQAISIPPILLACFFYRDKRVSLSKVVQGVKLLSPFIVTVVAYLAIRFTSIGVPAQGPYKSSVDSSILVNIFSYIMWSLNDLYTTIAAVTSAAGTWPAGIISAAVGVVILLTLLVVAQKQPVTVAFAASWFLIALLPVLPFTHHTQDYYVNVPCVGIAILIACAIGGAEKRKGILAGGFATAYTCLSLLNLHYQDTHSWAVHRGKLAYAALSDVMPVLQRLPHRSVLYFSGVGEDEYWAYNFGDVFKLYYPEKDFLTLFEGKDPLPSDYRTNPAFYSFVLFNGHLHDATSAVRSSKDQHNLSETAVEAIPFQAGEVSSAIDFAKGDFNNQLLKGWYGPEAGHRWIGKDGEAILRVPQNTGRAQKLTVEGIVLLDNFPDKALTIDLKAGETVIATKTITKNGEFVMSGQTSTTQASILKVGIHLNQTFRPSEKGTSNDSRDLGVALTRLELL